MLTLDISGPAPSAFTNRKIPWSSLDWCDYFHRQQETLLSIPWERGAELTVAERDLIAASLQVFQQGEAQEGAHFYRCARAYAEASADSDYAEAHRLFMNEEKRHGRDLARFLTLAGVAILTKQSRLARAFCWCGSRGGLELTLLVILISEIIALVYYAAVRRATGSIILHRLCAQILRDEKQHVRFHCERLAIMRRRRPLPWLTLTHVLDVGLLVGATLACWIGHRRVLCAGGFSFVRYCQATWHAYRAACRMFKSH